MDAKTADSTVKAVFQDLHSAPPSSSSFSFLTDNFVGHSIRSFYDAFSNRRAALGLSNPGTVENIAKEVQRDVLLNNYMFTGVRAELSKALSVQPLFQTAHNLTMGNENTPSYSFAALYGSPNVFLQGNLDNDLSLSARFNLRWSSALVSKASLSIGGGDQGGKSMLNVENDYTGDDFSASLKAMNPSVLEGPLTGIFVGSYLQSITPKLALGFEAIWQRAAGDQGPETALSYALRYKGQDWIGSAQLLAQGGLQGSYWRKITDKLEAGCDLSLQLLGFAAAGNPMMMGMMKNEGLATIGAKYDFRASSFRGQIDSNGKVACYFEKVVAPPVRLSFAGEMDHSKNTCKLGLAIQIEAASEEYYEASEKLMTSGSSMSVPF